MKYIVHIIEIDFNLLLKVAHRLYSGSDKVVERNKRFVQIRLSNWFRTQNVTGRTFQ